MGEVWVSGPGAATALAGALVTDRRDWPIGRAHYSHDLRARRRDHRRPHRLSRRRRALPRRPQRRQPRGRRRRAAASGSTGPTRRSTTRRCGRRSSPSRARARARSSGATDRRRPWRHSGTTPSPRAMPPACPRSWRAPATPARTASSCSSTGTSPGRLGRLLEAGADAASCPAGLGARDTLRLEAGMPLYGNELDRETTPFEAGLGRLRQARQAGRLRRPRRARAGASPRDRASSSSAWSFAARGIARHGYPVHRPGDAEPSGVVTSGTQSPTLGDAIAMAYVPPDSRRSVPWSRSPSGARVAAEVVPLPFYKRPAPPAQGASRPWRCPTICATPRTTSGSGSPKGKARWASPPTPRTSWATSSSSSFPPSGAASEAERRSASSSRSRPRATCTRRSPARSSPSTRRWPSSPSWSTRTRTARAG